MSVQISKLEANPHIEGLKLKISELEKILLQANHDYYNTDTPLLTDNTFDILENILREKKPNSKVFDKIGASVSKDAVKLPYYLGSLDKVKPNEKSLTKWIEKHNKHIVISEKLDGLSCLLVISHEPSISKKLYKHGDGYEGQDISNLLDYIPIGNLDTENILKLCKDTKDVIALRGEIIIKSLLYNEKYSKMYPKARSLIAGVVNSKTLEKRKDIMHDMEIIFYELINPSEMTFQNQFDLIGKLGFNLVKYKLYDTLSESILPSILMDFKKASKYEIDGIVLGDSSVVYKRATSNNPEYAVAFKMQLEDQIALTTILNIEYNISKHGTLAPRIEYKPIVIKGDTHQYTTGFNLKYIIDNKLGAGSIIKIIKSGDVIPYIYEIVKSSDTPQMPDSNIKWHWNDSHVDGIVDDIENNNDVHLQKLIAFFKTMKIEGVGEGVVNKFINAGYTELKILLELTPDVIANINGFQLKSAMNIYTAIHKVIDIPQPLERIMTASGVFSIGLGEKKFKLILDAIPNDKILKNDATIMTDILAISGFSDKTAQIFISGLPKFIEWLAIHSMIKIQSSLSDNTPTDNKFKGMVAVFTGIRNTDLEKQITDGGGIISSSVSSKTTIIIAKDKTECSSKLNKARELGIPITNITEFQENYL